MIIPHQSENTTPRRCPRHIGMAKHIAGAIHTRALAVPQRKHTVIATLAAHFGLLATPTRRGRQFFVDTGGEMNGRCGQGLFVFFQLLIKRPERRAPIAGNKASRFFPRALIAGMLHQQHSDDRLRAGHKNMVFAQIIFVGQRDAAGKIGLA